MPHLRPPLAFAAALLLAGCAAHPPPGSAECVPKPLASLAVQMRAGHPAVDVDLDGHPVVMILDLGAQATVLSDAVADRLNLPRDPSALPSITGVGGSGQRWAATARHLTMGGFTLDDKRMEVAPMSVGDNKQAIDGTLGLDVLLKYDVDWDLPHGRVTLNAPSGCDGPPMGWSSPAVEVPLQHPFGMAAYGQMSKLLLIPLKVDDRPMTALLDTGSNAIMINVGAAAALEPALAGDRSIRVAGVGANTAGGTVHRFRSLTVAGETFPNVPMVVAPVPMAVGDMILSVGFMQLHRAWLPAGGDAIWFGPRVSPQPASPVRATAASPRGPASPRQPASE